MNSRENEGLSLRRNRLRWVNGFLVVVIAAAGVTAVWILLTGGGKNLISEVDIDEWRLEGELDDLEPPNASELPEEPELLSSWLEILAERDNDEYLMTIMRDYIGGARGSFGVQLIELSGSYRVAGVNQEMRFMAASTYKLFVAYSVLLAIDGGAWSWEDKVLDNQTVATCFEVMIVISNNECAEALYRKYGTRKITENIRTVGLSGQSGWIDGFPRVTASDLAKLLGQLEMRELPISEESRERWIDAMKRGKHKWGIPNGVEGVEVANKTGELNALIHDAAIVYSPKGTYVLVVLTDQSSRAAMVGLSREIEAAR